MLDLNFFNNQKNHTRAEPPRCARSTGTLALDLRQLLRERPIVSFTLRNRATCTRGNDESRSGEELFRARPQIHELPDGAAV